jgi:intracellular sulfur oxidation DsrE/DsrF family protein
MAAGTVVLVMRETLGTVAEKDREFGLLMMDKFLHSLEGDEEKPSAICFYTEGVRLVCRGSKVLLGLQLLQGLGVQLVVCQSCLEHYGLKDVVAVGEIGNMKQIAGLLLGAAKVVTV